MTLTPEQIARYEERAAKGETPVLPWRFLGYVSTLLGKFRFVEMGAKVDDGQVECRVRLAVIPPNDDRPNDAVCALAADDALLAFTRPLLERPVEGPWEAYESADGEWRVGRKPSHPTMPRLESAPYDSQDEAKAIARVRNEAWQRRHKEKGSRKTVDAFTEKR